MATIDFFGLKIGDLEEKGFEIWSEARIVLQLFMLDVIIDGNDVVPNKDDLLLLVNKLG